jgi:uncharacterized membrane protein YphA (DoxX/SURF4 family)
MKNRWFTVARWFIVLCYVVGSPVTGIVEFRTQALSQKFDLPPAFLYAVCAAQVACAVAVFSKRLAPWAALILSVITLGAIGTHLRNESPLTAIPALVCTVIQAWFGIKAWQLGSAGR